MNDKDTLRNRFQDFLWRARRREAFRVIFVWLLVLLLAFMAITAAGVAIGMVRGFTPTLTNYTRVFLIGAAIAAVVYFLWRPLSFLRKDRGATLIESSDTAFDGRVRTYLDTESRTPDHGFLPLLAKDGMAVAKRVPMSRIVPMAAILWPLIFVCGLIFATLSFMQRAPIEWRNAAQHVWAGWQTPGLVAVRSIVAQPGDMQLLSGENLNLQADVSGFVADEITLHVRSESEKLWQTSTITRSENDSFDFTLFRVVEPLDYYFSAAYTKSDQHSVGVVVPAKLETINASFVYPEWTQLPDEEKSDIGRISGVKNTQVTLSFVTDKPLNDGFLVYGDERLGLAQNELGYTVTITLAAESEYQLMDNLLDRDVPISNEYAVVIQGDEAPELRFELPGRDVTASPVEEVPIRLVAVDDYAITSLELVFSVNAGDWQTIDLSPTEVTRTHRAGYVFTLENLGVALAESALDNSGSEDGASDDSVSGDSASNSVSDDSEDTDSSSNVQAGDAIPMKPGDLISYYAVARDHDSSVETDMLLIDVRPFDRRFSQATSSGGGGGGGESANEGSEISRRQKEILIATWNLQRATENAGGETSAQADNGKLLAELQVTLAEQARTLADRSEARELVEQGDEIRQFVDYLRQAADAMAPSAEALDELAFSEAIQPQQQALQLLQRAEALFADIRLTQQEGQGGGGGAQPGKDMAEMFELEMDLARNQYEQPDRGGDAASSPQEQLDDIFEKLSDLARRQAALEEERARENEDQLTREERWRQEQLSRELEELREQLEQLQREGEESQQSDSGESQSGESSGQGGSQSSGEESNENQEGGSDTQQAVQEALEQLEQAQEALQESLENGSESQSESLAENGEQSGSEATSEGSEGASSNNGETEQASAADALQRAVDDLADQRAADLQNGIETAVAEADSILREQRRTEELLRDAIERAIQSRSAGVYSPGLNREQAEALAEQKRELKRDLDDLRNDVADLSNRFGEQATQTGELLDEAVSELDQSQASDILGISSDAINEGSLATVLPSESLVTNAIRDLRDRLDEAAELAIDEGINPVDNADLQVADALEQIRSLRQQLEQAGQQQGQGGQGPRQEQGQDQEGQGQEGQGQEGQGQEGQGQEGQGQEGQGQEGQGQEGQGQQGQGQQGQGQEGQGQEGQRGQGQGQGQEGQQQNQQGGSAVAQGSGIQQGSGSANQSTDGRQAGFTRNADAVNPEQTANAIDQLLPDLEALGLDTNALQELESAARVFRGGDGDINSARIEEEYNRALLSLENLELQIADALVLESKSIDQLVREGELSESAADYFRRLSEKRLTVPR